MIVVRTVADLREALAEYPEYYRVQVEETSDMGMGARPSDLELSIDQAGPEFCVVLIHPVRPVVERKYPAHIVSPED